MLKLIKYWLSLAHIIYFKNIKMREHSVLMQEISHANSLKDIVSIRTKINKFALHAEHDSITQAYSTELYARWNRQYKLIQIKLRG